MNPGKHKNDFTIIFEEDYFKKGDTLQSRTERFKAFLGWLGFCKWYHCTVLDGPTQEGDNFVYKLDGCSSYTIKWFRFKLWTKKIKYVIQEEQKET